MVDWNLFLKRLWQALITNSIKKREIKTAFTMFMHVIQLNYITLRPN